MKKYQQDRIKQLLFFVLFWVLAFVIMAAFESSYLHAVNDLGYIKSFPKNLTKSLLLSNLFTGLFAGLIIGYFEVYLLRQKLNLHRFATRLFIKLSIYLPLIILLNLALGFLSAVFNNHALIIQHNDWNELFSYINSWIFWLEFFIFSVMILLSVTAFQVQYWFNNDHITNFLYGKYNKGREEDRVILFLDMEDSTTIAEKLGHVMFFKLLNDCFRDITLAILKYDGKIIDYIGDEVVISWPIKNAKAIIEFFFGFESDFQTCKPYYLSKYNVFPVFKGGGHAGKVTIGEIGTETKSIIYAGDVMNSTSRIQGLCKTYKRKLVISKDLKESLNLPNGYTFQALGDVTLKGKRISSTVYGIVHSGSVKPL